MWLFWMLSLLPITVGMVLWLRSKEIALWEWLAGAGVSLLTALIFQYLSVIGMTSDTETWSGWVTEVQHHPRWVETYQEAHTESYPCGTDKDGNTTYCTRTYYTTEYATHPEHWLALLDYGKTQDDVEIDYSTYLDMKRNFGGQVRDGGRQSASHGGTKFSGDNRIYSTINSTRYVYPVTTIKSFENRIKAAPSLFSYSEVPTNVIVYPWPENKNLFVSDRLLGTASRMISIREWDILNYTLGSSKKVNLIMVGFPPGTPTTYGRFQEAKWIGGKKNDLVICFAGTSTNVEWVYVFGWTEKTLVKKNLESLLLENPINDALIPKIQNEVVVNYTIKDWTKFDYITIEPPTWSYWVYFIVMIITQTTLYIHFHRNDLSKVTSGFSPWRTGRRY